MVHHRPQAAFSVSSRSGRRPLTVTFVNKSTSCSRWVWDFGDRTTSNDEHPQHVYRDPGSYTVKLTAINPCGEHIIEKTNLINVEHCQRPHADFIVSVRQGTAPLEVQFSSQAHRATSWSWDFGDGSTSAEEHPRHIYRKPGSYSVILAVSNNCGSDQQISTNAIIVTKKPQRFIHIQFMEAIVQNCWMLKRPLVRAQIVDNDGEPIAAAKAQGYWHESPNHSFTTLSDHQGWAIFCGEWSSDLDARTFTISSVEKNGCFYNRQLDAQNSAEVSDISPVMQVDKHNAAAILATFDQLAMVNYPNPFNAGTEILYFLPREGRVSVKLYNSAGQFVATLIDEHQSAGVHSLKWDGQSNDYRPLASGLYFCVIESQGERFTRKMVLIK
ncbi:MAG: PKD domain-containing protein [Planctomycetota bacterium]|nr:MAG: PKD domain-containing protein [Planctomycetota bacterium]